MVPLAILMASLLLPLTSCYSEDTYPLADAPYLYPEEMEDEGDFEVHRRTNNNNFLRFGRSGPRYDPEYEDYSDDFARPTRSGKTEKNDHFIRFGRSKIDFLRFGRDPQRRDNTDHFLRLGRSIKQEPKRTKRDTYSSEDLKRAGANYLRFGRNSNFLRFGRDHEYQESPLMEMLKAMIEHVKKEQGKPHGAV